MTLLDTDPKTLQMKYVAGELEGLRQVISYLWDGEQEAFSILYFFKANYKEWPAMIKWLKDRKIRGKKLVELCQNESSDGGGYHLGATKILSMMKGLKHNTQTIKIDELL